MTVSELIAELQKMPDSAQVYVDVGTEQCPLVHDARHMLGGEDAWVLLELRPQVTAQVGGEVLDN